MSTGAEEQLTAEEEQKLRSAFQRFDTSGNGVLYREEFLAMVQSTGHTAGESIFSKMKLDANGTKHGFQLLRL